MKDRKEWIEAQSHEKWYWETIVDKQNDVFFERTEYYYDMFKDIFAWKKYKIAVEVWCWPVWILPHVSADIKIWVDPLVKEYINMWYHYYNKDIIPISGKWESMFLKSNISDITISLNAIDHADNPAKVIKEMIRITKPKWLILINTDLREKESQTDAFHINLLSEKQIIDVIKKKCKVVYKDILIPRVVTTWVEPTSWSINLVLKKL